MGHSLLRGFTVAIVATVSITLCACGGGGGGGVNNGPTPELPLIVEPFITDLQFPTSLAFLPNGDLLFTELERGVRLVKKGVLQGTSVFFDPTPRTGGEGFLGLAIEAGSSDRVYVFYTRRDPVGNRVIRFRLRNDTAEEVQELIAGLPVGGHNGGRLVFGRDGTLFISTGDTGRPELSQDLGSLAGKVLRITRDGGVPENNPTPDSPVFARGFRNPFGMAAHPSNGTVYVSDNGPNCNDELNRVVAGGDFGWRVDQPCNDTAPVQQPIAVVNPSVGFTGMRFYRGGAFSELNGQLLLGDFNTGTIRRYRIDEDAGGVVTEEGIFMPGGSGNIIDVAVGPEGDVYFATPTAIFRVRRG